MSKEIDSYKVELPDPDLSSLADKIVQVIEEGKQALVISINQTIKNTYLFFINVLSEYLNTSSSVNGAKIQVSIEIIIL